MFAYDNKCFENNFNSKIKNKNDRFVIQYLFKQITNKNQNATEKFKLFTTNQNRLRQNDATSVWRERMTNSLKFYFKLEKNDLNKKTDAKMSKKIILIKIHKS